jgi:hypothetical protein
MRRSLPNGEARAEAGGDMAGEHLIFDRQYYIRGLGRFVRAIRPRDEGNDVDPVLDASLCGLFLFGMYEASDPRIVATMEANPMPSALTRLKLSEATTRLLAQRSRLKTTTTVGINMGRRSSRSREPGLLAMSSV